MRTLVAILAMTSCAAFAQTHSPAQPASTPTLVASLSRPMVSSTTTPPAPAVAVAHNSTGDTLRTLPRVRSVVLDLTIDETGKPCAIKVVESTDPYANPAVVKSVSQYQYQPATLDGVAVPVHVKMHYNINPNRED